MGLILLTLPGSETFVRFIASLYGFSSGIIEPGVVFVEAREATAGRELMHNLTGTLGLLETRPMGFSEATGKLIAMRPYLRLKSKNINAFAA